MRPWILAETNYSHTKQCSYDVAVLPIGATEPHNLHLPYGTDNYEVEALGERACEAAWNRGAKVVMLPVIPYGTETNMASCTMAMNVNPSTLGLVIRDLIQSLEGHGVAKVLILNGHGGNEFKPLVRELTPLTRVQLFLCDWFRGLSQDAQREIFEAAGDHAGEMETSLGLAFFPDLVRTKPDGHIDADDGAAAPSRFQAINEGWVSITRPWHLLTTNTGCGNPHPASADKGRRLMDVMVQRLSDFLVELAESEVDDRFPFSVDR